MLLSFQYIQKAAQGYSLALANVHVTSRVGVGGASGSSVRVCLCTCACARVQTVPGVFTLRFPSDHGYDEDQRKHLTRTPLCTWLTAQSERRARRPADQHAGKPEVRPPLVSVISCSVLVPSVRRAALRERHPRVRSVLQLPHDALPHRGGLLPVPQLVRRPRLVPAGTYHRRHHLPRWVHLGGKRVPRFGVHGGRGCPDSEY